MNTKKEYETPTIANDPVSSLEQVLACDMKTFNKSVQLDITECIQVIEMINEYNSIYPRLITVSIHEGTWRKQLFKNIIEFYKNSMLFINEGAKDIYEYRSTINKICTTFIDYGNTHYRKSALLWLPYNNLISSIMLTILSLKNEDDKSIFDKLAQIIVSNICIFSIVYYDLLDE